MKVYKNIKIRTKLTHKYLQNHGHKLAGYNFIASFVGAFIFLMVYESAIGMLFFINLFIGTIILSSFDKNKMTITSNSHSDFGASFMDHEHFASSRIDDSPIGDPRAGDPGYSFLASNIHYHSRH
jgi:hypothetical protein